MSDYRDNLEPILDTCLQRLYTERWTLEECLAQYPDHREALEPLLRTALALRSAGQVQASPAFKSGAAPRMAARLKHSRRLPTVRPRPAPRSQGLFPRRLISYGIALAIVLIFAAGSAGTIYAADGSVPGEPLYGVKLTVEQAQLQVASPAQANDLRIKFAGRRLAEVEKLIARGDEQDLPVALNGYDQLIADITQFLDAGGGDAQSLPSIDAALAAHESLLQTLLAKVPDSAKPGINQAIQASQHGQQQAEAARNKHGKKPAQTSTEQPTEDVNSTELPGGTPTDVPGAAKPGKKGKPPVTPGPPGFPGNGPPDGVPDGPPNNPNGGGGK